MTTTFILKNTFIRFGDRAIIIFVTYGTYVDILLYYYTIILLYYYMIILLYFYYNITILLY